MIDSAGRGTARAEDAQGTPTQSHISTSILVYEERRARAHQIGGPKQAVTELVFRLDAPAPQERVVCERNRDLSRATTPAGGLSL